MARKVAESQAVAYFDDDSVIEPGFYLLKGNSETTMVDVQDGGEFEVESYDDDESPILKTDSRGRPVFKEGKFPTVVDVIKVKHESNMKPDRQVFPSPDGDGFIYSEDDEDGDE